ncbi:MAG: hypothetical protein ACJ790_19910 [Myxococcaceae bacterium]
MVVTVVLFAATALLQGAGKSPAKAPDAGVHVDAGTPKRPPPSLTSLSMDVPGAIETIEVPEAMDALGMPVKLKAVRSKQKMPELIEYFRRKFVLSGLYVPSDDQMDNPGPLPQVTGLDPDRGISYSVIFQPNQDGTTTAIMGAAILHARQPETAEATVPLYPGSSNVLTSSAEGSRTITYSVKASSDRVMAFYRDALGKTGYREPDPARFEKEGSGVQVWTYPGEEGLTRVVVMKTGE